MTSERNSRLSIRATAFAVPSKSVSVKRKGGGGEANRDPYTASSSAASGRHTSSSTPAPPNTEQTSPAEGT